MLSAAHYYQYWKNVKKDPKIYLKNSTSYLDSSLELIEAIDLQKDDICTFVSFVSNWPQT